MNELLYILGLIITFILGFFFKSYFPSYFQEKGKNLATKEDIVEITNKIEGVKFDLTQQSELVVKKREVYDEMVKSLAIFFDSTDSKLKKEKFLDDYARFWLWASDDVIRVFNAYVDINIALADEDKNYIGEKTIEAFDNLLFELRKDAGHKDTKLEVDSFRRMKF